MTISVLDKVQKIGTVAVSCPDGNFQHELDSHGGYSPGSDLAKSLVLDLASPLYSPGSKLKIFDRSGKGNHGTITGAAWVRLPSGLWALDFNGTSGLITIAHTASLNFTAMSYMCWVNFTSLANNPSIINKKATTYDQANGWHIYWSTDVSKWAGRVGTQDLASSVVSPSAGVWYCFGVSIVDGVGAAFYHNGQAVGTTLSTSFIDNTDEIRISKQANDYPGWFSGKNGVLARLHNVGLGAGLFADYYNQTRHLLGV